MGGSLSRALVLLSTLLVSCSAATPPVVSTLSEARAATGKTVRVTGMAQREKLGDSVDSPGLSVVCLSPRFADSAIGGKITIEGVLELTEEFGATVGPNGEISQGTEQGTAMYVIRNCKPL